MLEQLMSLVFLGPVTPTDAWTYGTRPVNQAAATAVRMEVSGRPTPGCTPPAITLPPARNGMLRFEDGGVRYEGTEVSTGNLVLRGGGTKPLTLTGTRTDGGLWSLGNDGRCVGVWKQR